MLSLYGIGVTFSAGTYALVGKVAIGAGMHVSLSFLIATILAGFTALSYAELGARLPRSAGEAAFVRAALRKPAFAKAIGFLVMTTGIVSSGAIVIEFVGYLKEFVNSPPSPVIAGVVMLLALIAAWGSASRSPWRSPHGCRGGRSAL
jgi:amino acid transporter